MAILATLTDIINKLTSTLTSSNTATSATLPPPWTGEPTILDVLLVKKLLSEIRPRALPAELIDLIIDHASYWPHTTSFPHPSCRANHDGNILVTRSLPLGYPDASVPVKFPLSEIDYASGAQRFHPPLPYMMNIHEATTPRILEAWKESSMPDTPLVHPCRKIVVRIRSHDQGWGGQYHHEGTYEGSFTWFDIGLQKLRGVDLSQIPAAVQQREKEKEELRKRADRLVDRDEWPSEDESLRREENFLMFHNRGSSIKDLPGWEGLRFDLEEIDPPFKPRGERESEDEWRRNGVLEHPFLPHGKTLQRNLTATKEFTDHEIVMRWDDDVDPESEEAKGMEKEMGRGAEMRSGELVRNLEVGDVVTVWASARFPGWMNVVERVEVKVYWAV